MPHRLCFEEKVSSSHPVPAEDKSSYPEAVAFGRWHGSEPMLRSLEASHLSTALYCLNNCESAITFRLSDDLKT